MVRIPLKSFLLATLLAAVSGSDEVRRVGITATGRVATSSKASAGAFVEVSARASGLTFWHALRKQLEARKQHLDSTGLRTESRNAKSASQEALWKAVFEVDQRFNNKLPCHLQDNTAYPPSVVSVYSKRGVASPRECSLMCAADPLGERSGRRAPCQSFTYNAALTECKFFESGQPAKAMWRSLPGSTSGPPCNLEGFRQEIQHAFEADIKQAVTAEKHLTDQLANAQGQLKDEKKHTEQLASTLVKAKDENTALKNEIVRSEKKITAPEAAAPKAAAKPATPPKAPAAPSTAATATGHKNEPKPAEQKHVVPVAASPPSKPNAQAGIHKASNDLKNTQRHVQPAPPSAQKTKAEPVQRVQERKPVPDNIVKTTSATANTPLGKESVPFVDWVHFDLNWALGACGLIVVLAIILRINIYLQGREASRQHDKHKPSNDALAGLARGIGSLKD